MTCLLPQCPVNLILLLEIAAQCSFGLSYLILVLIVANTREGGRADLGTGDFDEVDPELAEDSGDLLPRDRDNFEEIPAGNEDLPPAEQSGAGLNDACLQSGFSQAACSSYLFSDDPGGYCSTLTLAGVTCPEIQDPRYTYGNPDEALAESQEDIANTERAIEGFENTVPDDLGEQFAQN